MLKLVQSVHRDHEIVAKQLDQVVYLAAQLVDRWDDIDVLFKILSKIFAIGDDLLFLVLQLEQLHLQEGCLFALNLQLLTPVGLEKFVFQLLDADFLN